jgi:hypothetical protein
MRKAGNRSARDQRLAGAATLPGRDALRFPGVVRRQLPGGSPPHRTHGCSTQRSSHAGPMRSGMGGCSGTTWVVIIIRCTRPVVRAVGERPGRGLVLLHEIAAAGPTPARSVVVDVTWVDVDATEDPRVDTAVDAEYARKYRGSTSAIAHLTSPDARTMTMRVDPR